MKKNMAHNCAWQKCMIYNRLGYNFRVVKSRGCYLVVGKYNNKKYGIFSELKYDTRKVGRKV